MRLLMYTVHEHKWHGHITAVAAAGVLTDEHEQIENQCTICTNDEKQPYRISICCAMRI